MVETARGYQNIAAICATEGLAALMVGPFDLSVSMSFQGDWRSEAVSRAVADIVELAQDAGLSVLMPVFAPTHAECRALIERWSGRGLSCFMIGSDKTIMAEALAGWSYTLTGRP